jgi:oligopeptide/dipeptide ABC transporter ATP-binding protein
MPLVSVTGLRTHFFGEEGTVRAVDAVDFEIERGQTLGVVGESGCGKSVAAQSILRIVPPPGRIVEGEIIFNRRLRSHVSSEVTQVVDLAALDPRGSEIRAIRGAEIAMVFQEPMTSLSPMHTIGNQIMEAIILHQEVSGQEAREKAIDMLARVRMPQPVQTVDTYPHQLSGGMRQKGMIAMALSCAPSLLIADEPTTALDVTTQAQILELMRHLQRDLGMAIMYITHDLGVIAEMAEEVVVMYLGKVVERADVDSIFHNPQHPYMWALLKSIPRIGRKSRERLESIKGVVPDPYAIPPGCPFHPRCPDVIGGLCDQEEPPWVQVERGHWARCHLHGEQLHSWEPARVSDR